MRVAPSPLDLVDAEAVAAHVVTQVHGVFDEQGVKPVSDIAERERGGASKEVAIFHFFNLFPSTLFILISGGGRFSSYPLIQQTADRICNHAL